MSRLSTERFSDRVEHYIRYRPSYPAEVVELLERECGLNSSSEVADIGSGPGNLAVLLLPVARRVYGVEPNPDMRAAGEKLLDGYSNFVSVAAKAEETKLAVASVDLVTAAQAFHWFDKPAAKREFQRILRPGGWVALVWNTRLTKGTAFLREYEVLLSSASAEYGEVNHAKQAVSDFRAFFEPGGYQRSTFGYKQVFDWDGLQGRALSSSYVPNQGEPRDRFLLSLEDLFGRYRAEGVVEFLYETEVFFGRL